VLRQSSTMVGDEPYCAACPPRVPALKPGTIISESAIGPTKIF
jgi:hypothetical protein